VIPGSTHHITRRCIERRYLLRPDPNVTRTFQYCLAYAAAACGILVHGFMVLSNHLHLCITDPDARLPEFMHRLDGLLARSLNAFRGRWECFFAPGSYHASRLVSAEDQVAKLVYLLTNPVRAGLVSHSRRSTGASSRNWRFGEARTFERPSGSFFDPDGRMPQTVRLVLTAPPGLRRLGGQEADRVLAERVVERETELRASFRAEGRKFLGMDGVMRVDPNASPRSREPRRGLEPAIAAADAEERVAAIEELQAFRNAYREAWLQWSDGKRSAVFPWGTYLMRVRHRATCRPPPPN
jgi:REP element-mobilizing transposase RayT